MASNEMFLIKRDPNRSAPTIDGIESCLVVAADIGAARTAAEALDSRLPTGYFAGGTYTQIEGEDGTDAYDGGLFGRVVLDSGIVAT